MLLLLSHNHISTFTTDVSIIKVDREYGERIARGLGLDVAEVERLSKVSQKERVKATEV